MKQEIVLDVPYKEKDEAKMLGARWNPEIKKWYIPAGQSPRPFERWLSDGKTASQADDLRKSSKEQPSGPR